MQKKFLKSLVITGVMTMTLSFAGISAYASENKDKLNASKQTVVNSDSQVSSNSTAGSNSTNKVNSTVSQANKNNSDNKNQSVTSVDNGNSQDDTKDNISKEEEQVISTPHFETIDGKIYFVTKNGVYNKAGWFKVKNADPDSTDNSDYYLNDDFSVVTGWKKINNDWYYFDETGVKQTGWKMINYNWYHLDETGIMDTGWIKNDGNKYYLNDEGIMSVGKKYIDNTWYFFANDGRLQTGFYTYNGKDYYSDSDGVMVANQWIKTKNHKYYVKADSALAVGKIIIDGQLEMFDSNGRYEGSGEIGDYLYVKYLNVGTADCAFIKLPSGETALIDTGDVTTRDTLVNFLNSQDLKKKDGKPYIDYVIITHGHSDHIGGLKAVLDNFNVGKVYTPDIAKMEDWFTGLKVNDEVKQSDIDMLKYDYDVYEEAENSMKEHGLKFINTKKGEYIDKNKMLQFVESDKDFGGIGSQNHLAKYWGLNENSAVVYLNTAGFKGLFTGDMEWNSEKDFWQSDLLQGKEVDVLKVPHHGFDTSSTSDFISYVKAPVGIISRGSNNVAQNTAFNNLTSNGVSIYETSQSKNGGIAIYATDENWSMEP